MIGAATQVERTERSARGSATSSTTSTCSRSRSPTGRTRAENAGAVPNERLEFLGDAVLGVVVTEHIFRTYPDLPEGELAKLRASVVSAATLADVGRGARPRVAWCAWARARPPAAGATSRRSSPTPSRRSSARSTSTAGSRPCARSSSTCSTTASPRAPTGPAVTTTRPSLQELAARHFEQLPAYEVRDEGPDHEKRFFATVLLDGDPQGAGEGRSKKQAEQAAARAAWEALIAELEQPSIALVEPRAGRPGGIGADRATRSCPHRDHWVAPRRERGHEMPELPEVETIRRELDREVVGKRIKTVGGHRRTRRSVVTRTRRRSSPRSRAPSSPASSARASASSSSSTPSRSWSIDLGDERAAAAGRPTRTWSTRAPTSSITFTQHGQLRFVDRARHRRDVRHHARGPHHRGARAGRRSASTRSRSRCRGRPSVTCCCATR